MEFDEEMLNVSYMFSLNLNKTARIKEFNRLDVFIVYPIVYAIGLTLNTVSTYVFCKKNVKKQSCSTYLAARSLVDTGYLLTSMISWLQGFDIRISQLPGVCHAIVFTGSLCSFVSASCTVFITVENYIRICKPSMVNQFCNERISKWAVAVSFIAGAAINSVHITVLETEDFNGHAYCFEEVTERSIMVETIFIFADFSLTGILPIIINGALIIIILKKAKKARQFYFERKRRRGTNVFLPTNKLKRPVHGKVLALLLGLLSMHVLFRSPSQLNRLLTMILNDIDTGTVWSIHADVLVSFGILSCVNFATTGVIYFICGKSYRRQVCRLLIFIRDFVWPTRNPGEEIQDENADTFDRFSVRFQSGSSFALVHTQQTYVP